MAQSLSPSVEDWGPEEEKAFLRRLGLRVEADLVNEEPPANEDTVRTITARLVASEVDGRGKSLAIEDAVYEVARGLVADESEAVAFGDNIVNSGFFQDFFWNERQTPLIWVRSDRGLGFSDGVMVLDFGSESLVVARAPNEDLGREDWLVLAVADRGDDAALRSVVAGYIGQGWLPDRLSVAGFVSRSDIEEAFTRFLDAGFVNDWAALIRGIEYLAPGTEFSAESPEQRAACLSAYLDVVLSA